MEMMARMLCSCRGYVLMFSGRLLHECQGTTHRSVRVCLLTSRLARCGVDINAEPARHRVRPGSPAPSGTHASQVVNQREYIIGTATA